MNQPVKPYLLFHPNLSVKIVKPMLERYGSFSDFLGDLVADEAAWRALRMSKTSSRPLGDEVRLGKLGTETGRTLRPQKLEPKRKLAEDN